MHGRSAARFGPGLIAEDIIDGLPAVVAGLRGGSEAGLAPPPIQSEVHVDLGG
jgi:hypothetical protein